MMLWLQHRIDHRSWEVVCVNVISIRSLKCDQLKLLPWSCIILRFQQHKGSLSMNSPSANLLRKTITAFTLSYGLSKATILKLVQQIPSFLSLVHLIWLSEDAILKLVSSFAVWCGEVSIEFCGKDKNPRNHGLFFVGWITSHNWTPPHRKEVCNGIMWWVMPLLGFCAWLVSSCWRWCHVRIASAQLLRLSIHGESKWFVLLRLVQILSSVVEFCLSRIRVLFLCGLQLDTVLTRHARSLYSQGCSQPSQSFQTDKHCKVRYDRSLCLIWCLVSCWLLWFQQWRRVGSGSCCQSFMFVVFRSYWFR